MTTRLSENLTDLPLSCNFNGFDRSGFHHEKIVKCRSTFSKYMIGSNEFVEMS